MSSSDDDGSNSSGVASSSDAATADPGESLSEQVSEPEPDEAEKVSESEPDDAEKVSESEADDATGQSPAASGDDSPEERPQRSAGYKSEESACACSEASDGADCATGSGGDTSDACSSPGSDSSSATGVGDGDGRAAGPLGKATEQERTGNSEGAGAITSSGESSESSDDGSAAEAGTAATAKASSSKTFETFDVAQTLEEHVAEHNFPMHVRHCGACRFWKHRKSWSLQCSAVNPVTLTKETWLGHAGAGLGVCLFCAAFKGSGCLSELGRGTGSLRRIENIRRHVKCKEHQEAEAAWKERIRAEGALQGLTSEPGAATAAPIQPASRRPLSESGAKGVVATRALLEAASSFRSFDVWRDGLLGEAERAAVGTPWLCRRFVLSLAMHERLVTHKMLKEGAVFRLSADGLDRTYQVEIGTVLWSLPKVLEFLVPYACNAGWLEQLGPKGPWLVERLIGMREFPKGMDTDGKASMLEDCVRRACQGAGGAVDVALHKHVREETRAWVSDGLDLDVPLAATATFPHLVFHGWDEAHSAQALLRNSIKDDPEIEITDSVLVTRKKPPSLAKFLSTSTVFRNTVGLQQQAHDIAFVENFGWAPQRYNSRARPLARESRRWDIIFNSLGEESQGSNQDRRILARGFMQDLGGENSSRLLLGGLLADLYAEHYSWTATGDVHNPDAATVWERATAFLARLDTLFMDGTILAMPDTFSGVTLKFLRGTSRYPCCNSVQTVGLGDWTAQPARDAIKAALRRVQTIVANIKENMKLYRSKHSWLYAFTAFRLPSALAATAAGGTAAADDAEACLRRICSEAGLPEQESVKELRRMLKRAEWHKQQGGSTRQAWGRAAAEWPELHAGRRLVELFLVWKTSSGNVERRFRRFSEVHCPERAQLLDTSVEDIMLVDQAPGSKLLRSWLEQQDPCEPYERGCGPRWLKRVLSLHERYHSSSKPKARAARRDRGVGRDRQPERDTEAAFGRKRAAAVHAMVTASPSKRARLLAEGAPVLAALAQEAAQASGVDRVGAPATVVSAVAKRETKARARYVGGARAAAKARSARQQKVVRSATPGPPDRDADLLTARAPGLMLLRMGCTDARRKAERMRFQVVNDPLDFLARMGKQTCSGPREKGNVVLVQTADAQTDFGVCAKTVAALTGAFFTTPEDFVRQDFPKGIQYTNKLSSSRTSYHVAATANIQADLPTLPHLLRALARMPGGCVVFYMSPKKLCKWVKKQGKGAPRVLQRACVLCRPGEEKNAKASWKQLYNSPGNWILRFNASVQARCPGTKEPVVPGPMP